jgi:Beta-lactamase enzyme family
MRIVLAALFLGLGLSAAHAGTDCADLRSLARAFFDTSGLRPVRDEPWFMDCVVPESRHAQQWEALEAYAADANRFGLKLSNVELSGSTLRMDAGGFTLALRLFRASDNRIADLDGPQFALAGAPLKDLVAQIGRLPGKVTVLVEKSGMEIAGQAPDAPLQVSSSMKLGVLKTLLDQVAAGKLKLQNNALVRPDLKALPSGSLQQLPDYAPVTLHTLASLMMRDSDNTAADVLVDTVGKDAVAESLGLPWLMTFHQWFMLKADQAKYAEFSGLDATGRKAFLARMIPAVPLNYSDSVGGVTPEAGWHVSNRKLCALAVELKDSPFAQLESTFLQYDEWRAVASKAGGDQTSRNDTLVLTRLDSETFCVSVTWNPDEAISNDSRYVFLVMSLIEAVRRL